MKAQKAKGNDNKLKGMKFEDLSIIAKKFKLVVSTPSFIIEIVKAYLSISTLPNGISTHWLMSVNP